MAAAHAKPKSATSAKAAAAIRQQIERSTGPGSSLQGTASRALFLVALRQPISFGRVLQVQKTVEAETESRRRRSTGGERRSEPAATGLNSLKRSRTHIYSGNRLPMPIYLAFVAQECSGFQSGFFSLS
jgi:hypothetical protein